VELPVERELNRMYQQSVIIELMILDQMFQQMPEIDLMLRDRLCQQLSSIEIEEFQELEIHQFLTNGCQS
jgi:hypothetical protein